MSSIEAEARDLKTVRLADVTEAFDRLGLIWDFKTVIRELEVLGLALSSSDADDAIEVAGVLMSSRGSYPLAEILAEILAGSNGRRISSAALSADFVSCLVSLPITLGHPRICISC